MYATIEPIHYRTGEATRLVVTNVVVQLGDKAHVSWVLAGSQNVFENNSCILEGQSYASWGDDDQYVLTWLCEQLNLTLISIETGKFWVDF